jgi:CBS domain-containing protein
MALAGPGVNLLIGSILIIIHELFKTDDPYLRLVWLIGILNILLSVFNLIPAFPMDGGRVLRAWLAGRMSYIRATRTAAGIGKMFAIFMGIFGFLSAMQGGGGLWFILIAFFIYIGASEEEKSTEISVILEGVKIKDMMSKEVKTVNSGMSVEELVDIMFKFKHMGYPVVDDTEVKGIVTFTDVQKVPKEERNNVTLSQIMTKKLISLHEDDDAVSALKLMTINDIGRIIIINRDKKMVGIVTRTDLLRSVQLLE